MRILKVLRIGKSLDNDIVIDDDTLSISSLQATIRMYLDRTITICDESDNGTFVNNEKITKGSETRINRGDSVMFANIVPLNWSLADALFVHKKPISIDDAPIVKTPIVKAPIAKSPVEYIRIEEPKIVEYPKRRRMFSKPFSFKGRIRRLEYALTLLICFVGYVFAAVIFEDAPSLVAIISILLMWFAFAAGAKRCHDFDNMGWFQLIPYFFVVMLFKKGESFRNRFGESPK